MSPAPVATRSFRIRPAPAANLPGLTRQKLTFAYDARGRRILKRVFNWNTSTSTYILNSEAKFLYDGWNLLAEYNGMNANALVRSYVWGPDLSGSLQGAGGVGGLLWATVAPGSTSIAPGNYAPAYDGNGNIVAWIDLADSSLDGKRDYGAFGESVLATGPAASLPFAFSTKYRDAETELYYYGFRYYNPSTGRWLSRDPIGIKGGLNLYGMVGNDSVNHWDKLGLQSGNDCCVNFPRPWIKRAITYNVNWSPGTRTAANRSILQKNVNRLRALLGDCCSKYGFGCGVSVNVKRNGTGGIPVNVIPSSGDPSERIAEAAENGSIDWIGMEESDGEDILSHESGHVGGYTNTETPGPGVNPDGSVNFNTQDSSHSGLFESIMWPTVPNGGKVDCSWCHSIDKLAK
ncbi:RHS repeat-associated core domain-containing protein [bacterium]|nr:RHS repeat-associated core domain-containing protein [bacterium]